MGLFKSKEKNSVKCPACGSANTAIVKGTQAVMAYPGFFSGVANDPEAKKYHQRQCKVCKNIFRMGN
jgi:hypothetical protein